MSAAGDHVSSPGITREGPFWDVMEGRREPPPSAVLLGFRLVDIDPEAGTIEVAFTATEQFLAIRAVGADDRSPDSVPRACAARRIPWPRPGGAPRA